MRFRNLVLAALAAFGLAMPAQAQVTFEWHLVGINQPDGDVFASAQNNSAVGQNFFTGAGALVQGSQVTLQLMVRDNAMNGLSFNWGFGNGVYPPADPFNGVGFSSIVAVAGTNNASVFRPNGIGVFDAAFATPINSELAGPNPGMPGANYPLPAANFSIPPGKRPYAGLESFTEPAPGSSVRFDGLAGINSGNPWENGDFPRNRGGSGGFLMPVVNIRFTATGTGMAQLLLTDATPSNDIQVSGLGGAAEPGGLLDASMFGSYIPLNIQVVPVPEPTSMALVGVALAGFGYRKLRRKKTTEVVA